MAYHIEETWYNGYRCSCCTRSRTHARWTESAEEALAAIPTEFPTEDDGGIVRVTVKDGATGKVVAESRVTFAPVWQRGDGYKFTSWSRYVDEEAFPDKGEFTEQVIEGINHRKAREPQEHPIFDDEPIPPEPLKLVTDRTWSEICDGLQEARRQKDIREAEAAIAENQKKLAALKGG